MSFKSQVAACQPGSLTAKVIGYLGHTAPAGHTRDNYLDLKVQITQSTYASRGLCPLGLIGHVILEDTNAVRRNGKSASYITLGSWGPKCPTFEMGWFNNPGGARTSPPYGGPPTGGQWAIVQVNVKNSNG